MFRNKILLRADPPCSSFFLFKISLHQPLPNAFWLHSLCWKLSRSLRLSCFFQSDHIYIVYQRSQAQYAEQALKELTETLKVSQVLEEEEVKSGSLIIQAIDCGLRSLFLEKSNWSCLGDCYISHSSFGVIEERNHLHTFLVTVQTDVSDGLVIVVSPDVVQFCRFKILDMLNCTMRQRFDDGEEVIIDDKWHMAPCFVLPSLSEGCIVGVCRYCPAGEDFEHVERLWSLKHGLILPSEYFVKVLFMHDGLSNTQWFPSAFVLQGAGLTPVPQSIRTSKAISALEMFVKIIEDWDFFGVGHLKIKLLRHALVIAEVIFCEAFRRSLLLIMKIQEVSRLDTSSNVCGWTKVSNNNYNHVMSNSNSHCSSKRPGETAFSFKGLLSTLDFRTLKPACGSSSFRETSKDILLEDDNASSSQGALNDKCADKSILRYKTAKLTSTFMDHMHSNEKICSDAQVDDTFTLSAVESSRCNFKKLTTFQKPSMTLGSIIGNDDSLLTLRTDNVKISNMKDKSQVSGPEGYDSSLTVSKKGTVHSSKQEKKRLLKLWHRAEDKLPKKRAKQEFEESEIMAKVFDYHSKGWLGMLSVLELKSFLGWKKAKEHVHRDLSPMSATGNVIIYIMHDMSTLRKRRHGFFFKKKFIFGAGGSQDLERDKKPEWDWSDSAEPAEFLATRIKGCHWRLGLKV
ncbi:hypothetical protein H6P81_002763 [Aristolochia fimbriata]|uniref:Uncharacterized protein n=1 Tax=Aristolochia fimbriata TaxID=158543 RepID=A0AAV7FAN6_ARIFI|nr:hypothetical protein H6P81_002763 [Aristolochia fimbriata]